tara:strand:+ start:1169 stop:2116 length:948 start_codon:yes stop_codon:yes gene_type:complete
MATILADRQYTLIDYKNYEGLNMTPELEQDVIDKINRLAKRVGAPSYQKTPVFKRNHYHKRPINKDKISASDWQTIRNFKTTKLEKNTEGLEAQMDKIRSSLNKLTDKTYDIMLEDITCIMKDINKEENTESFEKIGEAIFEIGSFNKFWSALYARLYKDLISSFPFMKDICLKNFQSFKSLFKTINYCDANVDYDKFCEYNKENEKRRALSSFFVICAGLNIISKDEMVNIIIGFIDKVKNDISIEDKTNNIEEIVHNISIMIISGKQFIKELPVYTTILKEIENFANMNHKQYPSLSSKIVFKFMDLQEELED